MTSSRSVSPDLLKAAEEAIADYKARAPSLSWRERTRLESEIFNQLPPPRPRRAAFLRSALRVGGYEAEHRLTLERAGVAADPLWQLVEEGLKPDKAVAHLRKAQAITKKRGIPLAQAVRAVLSGPAAPKQRKTDSGPSKRFFSEAEELVQRFVAESLKDADPDPAVHDRIVQDFLGALRIGYDDMRRALGIAKGYKGAPVARVGRDSFRQACEVLGVDARFGDALAWREVQRAFKQRAAPLHPDRQGGSRGTEAEYRAVCDAYEILKNYHERFNGEPT